MEDIRQAADTLTEESRERIGETADTAIEKSREKWKELRGRGEKAIRSAQAQGEEIWEDTQDLVRKHPAKAVGLALLVGTVVGVLIGYRVED